MVKVQGNPLLTITINTKEPTCCGLSCVFFNKFRNEYFCDLYQEMLPFVFNGETLEYNYDILHRCYQCIRDFGFKEKKENVSF